ncbi:flagellar hook-basal body complex protein FliE [Pelagovum sp. HNIBRBA483]|uniref:flagellar hook-basal body complex protein FliE n=1 Tax=Pelagovum sp. HNIBRBA483 TaxID=3233341 RepID=UPI0034A3F4C6
MDISTTLAARAYAGNRTATAPSETHETTQGLFSNAAAALGSTLKQSEATAVQAMTTGADPYALVQALAQTELAVETAATVRDRVVEAYQEILRMPV